MHQLFSRVLHWERRIVWQFDVLYLGPFCLGMTDLTLDLNVTAEQRENLSMVKATAASPLQAVDNIIEPAPANAPMGQRALHILLADDGSRSDSASITRPAERGFR